MRLEPAIILALCLGTAAGAGEIYRWTDADGNVHFGDRPPDPDRADKVEVRPPPADPAAARRRLEQERRLLRAFDEERRAQERERREAAREAERRRRNCDKAREILKEYREAAYLYDENPDGSRRIFSHEERAAAEREAQEQVARWCGR